MAHELLADIERAETQTLAAGQLARRLLADHTIPTHRLTIKHRYAGDARGEYVVGLDIWARDPQALQDWAHALGARITSRPEKDYGLGLSLSVDTITAGVPVYAWIFTGDPAEIARHRLDAAASVPTGATALDDTGLTMTGCACSPDAKWPCGHCRHDECGTCHRCAGPGCAGTSLACTCTAVTA